MCRTLPSLETLSRLAVEETALVGRGSHREGYMMWTPDDRKATASVLSSGLKEERSDGWRKHGEPAGRSL